MGFLDYINNPPFMATRTQCSPLGFTLNRFRVVYNVLCHFVLVFNKDYLRICKHGQELEANQPYVPSH